MFVIEEELKKLPDQPGVYIMHDSRDAIIYIGKAGRLRKRVLSGKIFREFSFPASRKKTNRGTLALTRAREQSRIRSSW